MKVKCPKCKQIVEGHQGVSDNTRFGFIEYCTTQEHGYTKRGDSKTAVCGYHGPALAERRKDERE